MFIIRWTDTASESYNKEVVFNSKNEAVYFDFLEALYF
jgi:hypothetical protein